MSLAALVMAVGSFSTYSLVFADRFQEQINQLRSENNQKQAQLSDLIDKANSIQDIVNALQGQINDLQVQIVANQAKSTELKAKIAEAEAELAKQRNILGQNIKAMYLEGDITTLEMLASSNDLSDFVDKQQYRNAVKDKIKNTLDKITALKLELNAQKEEVERLIKEQTNLQQQIAAQKAEQNRLLNLNQSEQAALNNQISANKTKIAQLQREQELENIRRFGGGNGVLGGGGYPWGNAPCIHTGSVTGSCPNYDWGIGGSAYRFSGAYAGGWGYRNCTDWVAYRSGGRVPSAGVIKMYAGGGNAKFWDDAAQAMGRRVSTSPHEGDAAVSNAGYYGHVMYVESVSADGSTIIVSDYNRAGTGLYAVTSLTRVSEGAYRAPNGVVSNLTFVTF